MPLVLLLFLIGWRHVRRPGVDKFLKDMAQYYEIVVCTSNIAGIADPIISGLDKEGAVLHRLFREATKFVNGAHVKDLSALNRNMRKVISFFFAFIKICSNLLHFFF